MRFQLIRHTLPSLGIGGGLLLLGDVWPDLRQISIELQQLLQTRFGIGLNRVNWAFRLTNTAVDAFVGMNDEHVLAFVKAIDRADLDAVHVFALDTTFDDDVGHFQALQARAD